MPILHGANLSPFVRKVRIALSIKGIEYDQEQVIPFGLKPEFYQISPLGKIPVYEDGDFTTPDSSVIIDYLEHIQPEPSLYPKDPKDRARALFLEEYADTRLTETLAVPFFQRFVRANLLNEEPDEKLVQSTLSEKLPPIFDYFEQAIGDGETLVGDTITIADIAATAPFVNFRVAGEDVDAERWPKLAAYLERNFALPAWKAVIEGDLAVAGG